MGKCGWKESGAPMSWLHASGKWGGPPGPQADSQVGLAGDSVRALGLAGPGGPARTRASAPLVLRLLAAALCLTALPALAQENPVIRVNVNLVRVVATVKNPAGELVGDLTKEDFELYDNGVRQEVSIFERQSAQPVSVALMIDTSGSTGKDLKYETDAATRFLQALLSEGNAEDAVALYSFNADITLQHEYTHDYRSLELAFRRFRPEGATALYDAIRFGSQSLEEREGRKVVVIVTDGSNTMPGSISSHDALEAAQLSDAVIYPIVVVPITNDAGRDIGGEHALIYMAQGTGGRTFMPAMGPELDKAFGEILKELRTQYSLGFYPKNAQARERFHSLEVRLKRPDLKVSARNGYYGEVEGTVSAPGARISVTPQRAPKVAPPAAGKTTGKR